MLHIRRAVLVMVILAAGPAHIAANERPCVKVMVGESTNRGVTYSYRIVNRSSDEVRGLALGLDEVILAAMLPVPPIDVEAPSGWTQRVIRTEEAALWLVDYNGPESPVLPGGSLAGLRVRLAAPNVAYESATFTVYFSNGTTVDSVIKEQPVVPVVSCVEEDPATHALTARFQYENRNAYDVPLQIGPANRFVPGDESRGQPTTFLAPPSRPEQVRVPLAAGESLTWELGASTATATSQSPRCAP